MVKRGFLPCFSKYLHNHFPVDNLYSTTSQVEKVKRLVSAFIDSESPFNLKFKEMVKKIKLLDPTAARVSG